LWTFTTLISYSVNKDLKDLIREEGGIQIILDILKRYPTNAEVQLQCIEILGAITIYNAKNESALEAKGGISSVLQTLSSNVGKEKLVLSCCYVLHLLRNASSKQIIISNGGIRILIQILDSYPNNIAVLEKAIYALRSLCTAFPDDLVKAGIIQVLIGIMTKHMNNPEIQEQAIATLSGFSLMNPNVKSKPTERQELMVQHGIVPLLLRVILIYIEAKNQIVQWGCRILQNLAFGRDNIKKIIVENDGINLLLKILKQRLDDGESIANAAPVLTTIAANKNYKVMVKNAGGLEIVTRAMEAKLSDDATKACKGLQLQLNFE